MPLPPDLGGDAPSIAAVLREGRAHLAAQGIEAPRLDAEVLLRHALGLDRTALYARLQDHISAESLDRYRDLIAARGKGIPTAYLVGEREFMGLPFQVSPAVLIPRPETEILVAWALAWLRDHPGATVVDVGTGSGAIALILAATLGAAWQGRIIGSDISAAALAAAAANRARLALDRRVELVQGSLLTWLREPVDLILANLPYLRPEQIATNRELAAEPRLALDGGEAGLDLIRQLLADAPRVLAPGGAIGLEIDLSQRDAVVRGIGLAFPAAAVRVLPDLAGFDRHVVATLAPAVSP